uniref:Potassium channel tetramerization domain containing 14 n=1 Tax=Hucho hucho TaxID=62062 RepID=A0A4W5QFS0_9TELE
MSLPDSRSPGKQSSPGLQSCSVVQLNVGGHVFTTSLSTLRKHPDSQLAFMFSSGQQPKLPTDAKGRYFIDRDGTHFGAILQFLRTQRLPTESVLEVYQEALHYDIRTLVKQLQDSAQLFGETVGRQQFISRVPNYLENLEVLVRVARAEAIAARHSAVIVCVLRTEEDLGRYDNAVNNLEEQEVVRFGPWKVPARMSALPLVSSDKWSMMTDCQLPFYHGPLPMPCSILPQTVSCAQANTVEQIHECTSSKRHQGVPPL